MKPRTIFFIVLLAIVITGVLTNPGRDAFDKHISKNKAAHSAPIIERTNNFAFSVYKVTYFNLAREQQGDALKPVAVEGVKETWLGLFGRFWKL